MKQCIKKKRWIQRTLVGQEGRSSHSTSPCIRFWIGIYTTCQLQMIISFASSPAISRRIFAREKNLVDRFAFSAFRPSSVFVLSGRNRVLYIVYLPYLSYTRTSCAPLEQRLSPTSVYIYIYILHTVTPRNSLFPVSPVDNDYHRTVCSVIVNILLSHCHVYTCASPYLQYCDLDEFLSENGLPVEGDQQQNGTTAGGNGVNQGTIVAPNHQGAGALMPGVNGRLSPPPPASIHPIQHLQTNGGAGGVGAILTKREPSPSPSEPLSPITINPPSPADSSE